ncbi:MAG TPA: hypothetical protein VFV38_23310 [Ktedonobacteraceae bacterium]|nr:hypothetical protein [Ktedonobacteraceae bacterium]
MASTGDTIDSNGNVRNSHGQIIGNVYIPGDAVGPDVNFAVDTEYVHSIGQAIASTANDEKWNTPTSVFNLGANMSSYFGQLPQVLQEPLNRFSGNYHNGYENLLDERIAIGHGLIGTASAAEETELRNANRFPG